MSAFSSPRIIATPVYLFSRKGTQQSVTPKKGLSLSIGKNSSKSIQTLKRMESFKTEFLKVPDNVHHVHCSSSATILLTQQNAKQKLKTVVKLSKNRQEIPERKIKHLFRPKLSTQLIPTHINNTQNYNSNNLEPENPTTTTTQINFYSSPFPNISNISNISNKQSLHPNHHNKQNNSIQNIGLGLNLHINLNISMDDKIGTVKHENMQSERVSIHQRGYLGKLSRIGRIGKNFRVCTEEEEGNRDFRSSRF